jgi:two-component system chemotaxis response regulator CheY
LHWETDGFGAKEFLTTNPVRPKLIVSDLNMARMNGLRLLEWVRQSREFSGIRFVVLTSSTAESDVTACQAFGADAFHTKPSDHRRLVEIIRQLSQTVPVS